MLPPSRTSRSSTSATAGGRILAALLFLLPLLGRAQSPPDPESSLRACEQSAECSAHLSRANQLYDQNVLSAALVEFHAAYLLQPYPLLLYNIARIHHKQSHYAEAIAYYQRYLDTGHPDRVARARQLLAEAKQEQYVLEEMPEPAPAPLTPDPGPAVGRAAGVVAGPAVITHPAPTPVYKRWWFWTAIGIAVAGAALAGGVGAYASGGPDVSGLPATHLTFSLSLKK